MSPMIRSVLRSLVVTALLGLPGPGDAGAADASWTPRFHTPTNEIVRVLSSPDDQVCWFITNFDRIYKTADGGQTWASLTTGAFVPSGLFVMSSSTAFKTSSNSILKTTNGGVTWTSVFSQPGAGPPVVWMYTATAGFMAFNGALFRTADGGGSWTQSGITQPPAAITTGGGKGVLCMAGENLWVALAEGGAAVSRDLGATWTLPLNQGLGFGRTVRISFANAAFGLAIQSTLPYIYVTTDSANHWVQRDNSMGFNEDVLAVGTECWYIPNPADHMYIKYSADAGLTWFEQLFDGDGFFVLHRSRNGSTLWAGTGTGTIYTYSGATTGVEAPPRESGADIGADMVADILLRPNPFHHEIQLAGRAVDSAVHYRIVTADGRIASSGDIRDGLIDGSHLAAGCYVIELIDRHDVVIGSQRVLKR